MEGEKRPPKQGVDKRVKLSDWLDLHSAHDVDGLRFAGVAEVGHAEDGTQQVHIQPQRVKVTLTEQFHVRGQEILGRKDRDVITKGFLQLCSWKRGNYSERKAKLTRK